MAVKRFPLVLSVLSLGFLLALPSVSMAKAEKHDTKIVKSKKDFKDALKNNKKNKKKLLVLSKTEDVGDEFIGENDKFTISGKTQSPKLIGVMDDGNDRKTPLYIFADKNVSDETLEKAAQKAYERYLEKSDRSEKIKIAKSRGDSKLSASSTDPDYELKDSAVRVWVTESGEDDEFWYTEYRVYGAGPTSTVDQFYLRADHEHLEDTSTLWTLMGFEAEWEPTDSDIDIHNPEPNDSDDVDKISISIPWSIQWEVDTGGDVDIERDFDSSDDSVKWKVYDYQYIDYFTMEEFEFTHGVEIESPISNDGFVMDVDYGVYENDPYSFSDPSVVWSDEVHYDDSEEDAWFED
jgi:hypothetical protein